MPGLKKTVFFVLFSIALFTVIGFSFYLKTSVFFCQKTKGPVFLYIEEGWSIAQVAEYLAERKVICSPTLWVAIAVFQEKILSKGQIKAGFYRVEDPSFLRLFDTLINGDTFYFKITVPEGSTLEDISYIVNKELRAHGFSLDISFSSLKIKDFADEYEFLNNIDPENSLEGFFFPDTYLFTLPITEKNMARLFLDNFEKKAWSTWKKTPHKKRDLYETLIMASVLEKEVRGKKNKRLVADILWRRLEKGMLLQVDSTLNYLLKNKRPYLSGEELHIDSPYNTYKYPGLPPTPISNPGLESFVSALQPLQNPYWFYLTDKKGKVYFSKTYTEHLRKKRLYVKD